MRFACTVCGTPSSGRRCPAHRYTRNPASHKRFARAVKARDQACQRCGRTDNLVAHHVTPLHQGGTDDPTNGMTLCTDCHRDLDPFAR